MTEYKKAYNAVFVTANGKMTEWQQHVHDAIGARGIKNINIDVKKHPHYNGYKVVLDPVNHVPLHRGPFIVFFGTRLPMELTPMDLLFALETLKRQIRPANVHLAVDWLPHLNHGPYLEDCTVRVMAKILEREVNSICALDSNLEALSSYFDIPVWSPVEEVNYTDDPKLAANTLIEAAERMVFGW